MARQRERGKRPPAVKRVKRAMVRLTYTLAQCDTLGKLIVYLRESKGWDQHTLVALTGLKQSRLSSLERDTRKPSFEEMDVLALFLEQSLQVFSTRRPMRPQGVEGAHDAGR
ncbi:MAG: helix-turn-helix transcriptional regulator [Flavobacteriales bacterium]|nr:helix-turn-helix transcriptional regulator [Flavobacteriales bacterium]